MLNEISILEAGELVTYVGICLYPGSGPGCNPQTNYNSFSTFKSPLQLSETPSHSFGGELCKVAH